MGGRGGEGACLATSAIDPWDSDTGLGENYLPRHKPCQPACRRPAGRMSQRPGRKGPHLQGSLAASS